MSYEPKFPDDFMLSKTGRSFGGTIVVKPSPKQKQIFFSVFYLKHDSAVKWMSENILPIRVKSQQDYVYKYIKHEKFPVFMPLRPDLTYKRHGWISWGHFLGTGNVHNPTIYKNMTPEIIQNKKHLLCSMIEFGSVSELMPIYEFLKNKNSAPLYNYCKDNKIQIMNIVRAIIRKHAIPFPKDIHNYFDEGFFHATLILEEGRFRPEKLIKRKPLYSWISTIIYIVLREDIVKIRRVELNNISEKYLKETWSYQND